MDQHGRPEVILIGFCDSALPELQILKAEINKSCSVLLMDLGRWQASLAAVVDIAPSEWLLKESGGNLSNSELAELSEEAHCNMVATNAEGWLQAMLSKFDGVIALGGSVLGDRLPRLSTL
jgi:NADP-dependent 3-hydroxy acid dehydrogenase YdfG